MSAGGNNSYEINLTPYIDLMSTLIVFLLMTAVWNQIAMISTDSSSTTAGEGAAAQPGIQLSVTVMPGYLELNENSAITKIPHRADGIDRERFKEVLKNWKTRHPSKNDVVLSTENSVTYKMLISTFDTLVGENFPDVGVNTQ